MAYDDNSIDQLDGANRIRTRPSSVLGSDGIDGARHGVIEIIGNAVDEHSTGYGDKIDIKYLKDNSVVVRDYGRGVPIGWNEKKKKWNWFLIFGELYAGGKYDDNQDKLKEIEQNNSWNSFDPHSINYLFSIGLNGLGAASTQYTAEYFDVTSYRDGEASTMRFKRGNPVQKELTVEPTDEPDGTLIHWKPDDTVFTDVDLGSNFMYQMAQSTSYVSEMEVHYVDEFKGIDEVIPAGDIQDYLLNDFEVQEEDLFRSSGIKHGKILVSKKEFIYILKYDLDMAIVPGNGETIAFHNAVRMQGREDKSAHHVAVQHALDSFFKNVSKDRGVRIRPSDYDKRFAVVINSYSNYASYANQTKDLVDDAFIESGIESAIKQMLSLEYDKHNKNLLGLIDSLVEEINIRAEVEEQRKLNRQAKREVKKATKKSMHLDNFSSSRLYRKHKVAGNQLLIVEGNSASGATRAGRNADTQAIIPIRGKILNVLKASMEKILANKEVMNIIGLVGGGMDLGEEQQFDISKMRFEEVLILTDADEDGYQIRALVMLIFLRFMPEVIKQGRLFICNTPLFEMHYRKEIRYALNKKEQSEIISELGEPQRTNRFKGLGQVDAEVLHKTTLDFEQTKRRNLVPIKFDTDNPELYSIIDTILGTDEAKQRKNLILKTMGPQIAEVMSINEEKYREIQKEQDLKDDLDIVDVVM